MLGEQSGIDCTLLQRIDQNVDQLILLDQFRDINHLHSLRQNWVVGERDLRAAVYNRRIGLKTTGFPRLSPGSRPR
jgi:hypothetical protein